MSGTSIDAIDAVLMDFSQSLTHLVASYSQPIDRKLKNEINRLIANNTWPQEIEQVDTEFANASTQAVKNLLATASIEAKQISAIGSHGQTIFHAPNETPGISIQIGNAEDIAKQTGITTVADFRQADIDAGGQGAPIACAYHAKTLQHNNENRIVLNLGGIANITLLPANDADNIIGFDTGPANSLLDAWIKKHQAHDFDENGTWAKSGTVNKGLLNVMLEDEYFKQAPPKSTGREKFNLIWLQYMLDQYEEFVPEKDVQATLTALTAQTISDSIRKWAPNTTRILLSGGGSNNSHLVSQLQHCFPDLPLETTSNYGISEEWMEAMAFAWLAKQNQDLEPGNIPSVTGADKPVVLGDVYFSD